MRALSDETANALQDAINKLANRERDLSRATSGSRAAAAKDYVEARQAYEKKLDEATSELELS